MRLERTWQSVRQAVRGLRRQPGFTIPVLGVLSLGITANTAMFTVLNSLVLHPTSLRAWKNPARVLTLWERNSHLTTIFAAQLPARYTSYRAWKLQSKSFADVSAWRSTNLTLTGGGSPERVEAGLASAGLFSLVGVSPRLGRNFSADEMTPGRNHVVILSDELFRSRFAKASHVIGSTLTCDGAPYTVVGVLPPGVAFPDAGPGDERRPKLWLPLVTQELQHSNDFALFVFGRLREGVSESAARAELTVIETQITRDRNDDDGVSINVIPLLSAAVDQDMRSALTVLQVAVGFLLLIACTNAGNLMLSRAMGRQREIAIRAAVGAGNRDLMLPFLIEGALLASTALILSLPFTGMALRLVSAMAPADAVAFHELQPDWLVIAFTLTVCAVTTLLSALAPAFYSRRTALNEVLSRSSRTSTGAYGGLRKALSVVEIALSVLLIAGAGLTLRSFTRLMSTELGFRIDNLMVMNVALPRQAPEKIKDFNDRLLESVRRLPDVETAALTTGLPMRSLSQANFEIEGRPTKLKDLPVADFARVSDGYFETMKMAMLAGRAFTRTEALSQNPGVAVINRALATKYFTGADPLKQTISFDNDLGVRAAHRIVGVVGNESQMGPDNSQDPAFYLPGDHLQEFLVVVRTKGNPPALNNALRQQVWSIDKNLPISPLQTEEAALSEWMAPRRFNMTVLIAFACLGVLLAATGLYSVLAYGVSSRTREIGIRIAIGASPNAIVGNVLGSGIRLSLAGLLIGVVLAAVAMRFMSSLLYGVEGPDWAVFAGVAALVLLISVTASWLPARRASRTDAVPALRAE